jgi:hypothetical protein
MVLVSAAASTEAATVRGTIEHEGAPLPGVTVTLLDGHYNVGTVITNVHGRFEFASAGPGRHSVEATLEGFVPIEVAVTLSGADVDIGTQQMVLSSVSETITLSCGTPCDGSGEISCKEYELHRALEDEALSGDAVAMDYLQRAFDRTQFDDERARLASFLAGALENRHERYVEYFRGDAEAILSWFEREDGKFDPAHPDWIEYCEYHGIDPADEYYRLESSLAFLISSWDPIASSYATRIVRAPVAELMSLAVLYAGLTCDATVLDAIDQNFDSVIDSVEPSLVSLLSCGHDGLRDKVLGSLHPQRFDEATRVWQQNRDWELARSRRLQRK